MPCRAAKSAARSALRDPTATTVPAVSSFTASASLWAIPPGATIPHRSGGAAIGSGTRSLPSGAGSAGGAGRSVTRGPSRRWGDGAAPAGRIRGGRHRVCRPPAERALGALPALLDVAAAVGALAGLVQLWRLTAPSLGMGGPTASGSLWQRVTMGIGNATTSPRSPGAGWPWPCRRARAHLPTRAARPGTAGAARRRRRSRRDRRALRRRRRPRRRVGARQPR